MTVVLTNWNLPHRSVVMNLLCPTYCFSDQENGENYTMSGFMICTLRLRQRHGVVRFILKPKY